jgi:hypothetical protein
LIDSWLDDFLICLEEGDFLQVLVQVGDVLDRGEDEIAILSLLAWLGKQARSKGGVVFQVLFNCFVLGKVLSSCHEW